MSRISVTNLTFAYDGSYDTIFENVSFQLDTDWKLGFTGRNGRGKTTFFNLLMGNYEYRGKISADVQFDYFPFNVPDKSLCTYDVVNDMIPDFRYWELSRELSLLRVSEDILYRPFDTLSNGEQTKVLLAALFLKENHFLLIDEPTNHLDMESRQCVSDYLNAKKGFILISHDRAFLDSCVDHILSINRANIEIQKGNFSSWWENKQMRDHFEITQNEKIKKDIQRLSNAAKRTAEWSDAAESRKIGFDPQKTEKSMARRPTEGAKAKKMMARSKAIQTRQIAAIQGKSKLLKNIEKSDSLKITSLGFHTDTLVALEGITIAYGEKIVCRDVSFTVEQGERVALSGQNGSGKSSLIKLICGEGIPYTGRLRKSGQLKISCVSQDTSHLRGGLTDYAEAHGIDESLFKAILRKLDFSRAQFEKNMGDFSGGQKKKVLIARSLCEQAHLHIWDEPLNFIDVLSRMQIEELLLEYTPTLLFVEHDREFCGNIATKMIEL